MEAADAHVTLLKTISKKDLHRLGLLIREDRGKHRLYLPPGCLSKSGLKKLRKGVPLPHLFLTKLQPGFGIRIGYLVGTRYQNRGVSKAFHEPCQRSRRRRYCNMISYEHAGVCTRR